MPRAEDQGEGWPPWVEEWVLPYVEDYALWPVLIALLGHVEVMIVGLEVPVLRYGMHPALGVLGVFAWSTWLAVQAEWKAIGRLGRLSLALGLTWVFSFPLAWWAESTGVL